jgi:hypothetical protein
MTEVKHGPNPKFNHKITGDPYGLTVVGYYTAAEDWTAGGVTTHQYSSHQGAKRLNELLGMRTIFLHWWLTQWLACGGDLRAGEAQVAGVLRDTAEKIRLGLA